MFPKPQKHESDKTVLLFRDIYMCSRLSQVKVCVIGEAVPYSKWRIALFTF